MVVQSFGRILVLDPKRQRQAKILARADSTYLSQYVLLQLVDPSLTNCGVVLVHAGRRQAYTCHDLGSAVATKATRDDGG